jgi:Mn-dependent DtxR family transcriptional regulator
MSKRLRLEALKRGHGRRKGHRRISDDYLETIHELTRERGKVRPIDVSRALSVAPSTVKKVLARLEEEGYVSYEPYRALALTARGEEKIKRLKRRHDALAKLFTFLGMDELSAEVEAEKIEHSLSEESTGLIEALVVVLEENKGLKDELTARVAEKLAQT